MKPRKMRIHSEQEFEFITPLHVLVQVIGQLSIHYGEELSEEPLVGSGYFMVLEFTWTKIFVKLSVPMSIKIDCKRCSKKNFIQYESVKASFKSFSKHRRHCK